MLCVFTGCSVEEALEAASLHPAQLLRISHKKGNLDYGSDAGQDSLQVVISAVHKQRLPSNIKCIYCVWLHLIQTSSLQTSFCSTMTSTSKPPIFLERRFGEEDHRRRRRLQMESGLTAGTLSAFRGRCLPQNHKAVECLNSSEHTVILNFGPGWKNKTRKKSTWCVFEFMVHQWLWCLLVLLFRQNFHLLNTSNDHSSPQPQLHFQINSVHVQLWQEVQLILMEVLELKLEGQVGNTIFAPLHKSCCSRQHFDRFRGLVQ